jgi:uncharacterized protein
MLSRRFKDLSHYRATELNGYKLLPIRFTRLDGERYVVSNISGEYLVLGREVIEDLVEHRLAPGTSLYDDLKSKHFIYDDDSSAALALTGLKYRTKLSQAAFFTGLHIFVVTLRCDYSCPYCQVSRQTDDKSAFDMSFETANKALDLVFMSPNPSIKIEFQGGEPLLNFPLVQHIVERAKQLNETFKRNLQFVIATNLSFMSDDVLDYCSAHDIHISTSLDGPASLHNKNRPRPGKNGHALVVEAIKRIQVRLGRDRISALMTTTLESISDARSIIDEYVSLGLREVFLRPLSPYGFAVRTGQINRYDTDRWLEFYKEGLAYILELNRNGYRMREIYSTIVLRKMLTAQEPGYVDLRSPAGTAIAAIVYNYDGYVYASDEARMLAEMGEDKFRLGNLHSDSYETMLSNDNLMDAIEESISVSSPMCNECAFMPYCGSDPVYHYATQRDFVGRKATSGFCQKNMGVFRHLIQTMEDDPRARSTLQGWAS